MLTRCEGCGIRTTNPFKDGLCSRCAAGQAQKDYLDEHAEVERLEVALHRERMAREALEEKVAALLPGVVLW